MVQSYLLRRCDEVGVAIGIEMLRQWTSCNYRVDGWENHGGYRSRMCLQFPGALVTRCVSILLTWSSTAAYHPGIPPNQPLLGWNTPSSTESLPKAEKACRLRDGAVTS